jgi:hypothetical protein
MVSHVKVKAQATKEKTENLEFIKSKIFYGHHQESEGRGQVCSSVVECVQSTHEAHGSK